jgi:diguanylate cyclase (GGDEF)-like protein
MKNRTAKRSVIEQEAPEESPPGWADVQTALGDASGLSLLLVDGYQPPALTVSNNNSICQALQSSAEYVGLCDPYCGTAHRRAHEANGIIHYRCHAGLQCFAMPLQIGEQRQLAMIGGRAFVNGSDYRELVERFRGGDLRGLSAEEVFRNVVFADEAALDHLALRVSRSARDFHSAEPTSGKPFVAQSDEYGELSEHRESAGAPPEIKPRALANEVALTNSIRSFAEHIDASDPAQTYQSIVAESADLLQAERGSLLLFDEAENRLTVTAARGIPAPLNEVGPVQMGEGIAGSVMKEGRALVATIEQLGKQTRPERRYKTGSFISYPITIGQRKFGVLNLADKIGGGVYDARDLSVVDLVAPQIALALERAEWQQRANQFQLMSITDPLTGLHNRRYLESRLTEELSRSKRYEYPLSFMMIDIDDFKFYNDRNGHQAGDRALEITAQCLHAALRKVDVASRYGGEEFSILLPQTSLEEAAVIADRIRRKILNTQFPRGKSQPLGAVTVSIGLSSLSSSLDSAEAIVRAADRALYHAKRHGKNRAYAYQAGAMRSGERGANPAQHS